MSAHKEKILVVDDDPTIRDVTRALLENNGYDVRTAADGEAAISQLKVEPCEVVLLDILMPRKEGLETILELKKSFPQVKIFAMSASGSSKGHDFLTIAARFGATGILQKPFSPKELFALLQS
jgi:DNA-binding response OmpR family regulator